MRVIIDSPRTCKWVVKRICRSDPQSDDRDVPPEGEERNSVCGATPHGHRHSLGLPSGFDVPGVSGARHSSAIGIEPVPPTRCQNVRREGACSEGPSASTEERSVSLSQKANDPAKFPDTTASACPRTPTARKVRAVSLTGRGFSQVRGRENAPDDPPCGLVRPAAWSALRRSPQGTDCGSMRDMLVSGTTPAARQFLTTLFAKRCLGNRTARAVPRHSKRHGAFATVLPASKPGRTRRYAEAAPPANRAGGGR